MDILTQRRLEQVNERLEKIFVALLALSLLFAGCLEDNVQPTVKATAAPTIRATATPVATATASEELPPLPPDGANVGSQAYSQSSTQQTQATATPFAAATATPRTATTSSSDAPPAPPS